MVWFPPYPITYTVSDTAGNAAKPVTRLVIVSDQDPPNIILSGNALVELEVEVILLILVRKRMMRSMAK